MEIRPKVLVQRAGQGFATGQLFSAGLSLGKAIQEAPQGQVIDSFYKNFMLSSYQSALPMTAWSLVSGMLAPTFFRHIKNDTLRDFALGATTGAILEFRNGYSSMVTGAVSGIFRSIQMNIVSYVFGYATKPLRVYHMNRKARQIQEKRNKVIAMTPMNALCTAFLK